MSVKMIEFPESVKRDAENYLLALAMFETIAPIVINYQKSILLELGAKDLTGKDVTDSRFLFTIEDQSIVPTFLKRCDEEAAKNNLKHEPDHCPMLTAENIMIQAKRLLIISILPCVLNGEISEEQALDYYRDKSGNLVEDKFHKYRYITWGDKLLEIVMPAIIKQFKIDGKELRSSL